MYTMSILIRFISKQFQAQARGSMLRAGTGEGKHAQGRDTSGPVVILSSMSNYILEFCMQGTAIAGSY